MNPSATNFFPFFVSLAGLNPAATGKKSSLLHKIYPIFTKIRTKKPPESKKNFFKKSQK
jgi:hypothetical protein